MTEEGIEAHTLYSSEPHIRSDITTPVLGERHSLVMIAAGTAAFGPRERHSEATTGVVTAAMDRA